MALGRILPNDCQLSTKGDLKLIDILYQQDVDLGVGKEIFDPTFREELEREREFEFVKQQERQKTQLLAKEKEEREKKEQKDRWLKKNFRRDGETGEWVQLWSDIGEGSRSPLCLPIVGCNGSEQELTTLEAALNFLEDLGTDEDHISTTDFSDETHQEPLLMRQDSFNENWNGLVDYLNMAANSADESLTVGSSILPQLGEEMNVSVVMTSDLGPEQDVTLQSEYLIQNATLPAAVMDVYSNFSTLTPPEELNSSMPFQPANMNSGMDFDLGDLGFFSNLSSPQNVNVGDIDLADGDGLFQNVQDSGSEVMTSKTFAESMDAIHSLEDSLCFSACSVGSASPLSGFNDAFDGLEGATGGSDYMNDQFSKVSCLSESSRDSGFAYQGGFSSPSSTSSYTGSPASSHGGINSTASSNDTEHDPHGTRTVVHPHVAHNHTYNTPPGQTPREIKKYAQKVPSRKGPQSRDHRRAEELKIPFTIEDITDSSVEKFSEMLSKHKLNEAQLTLVRDIRRRGKNKVAAQNCRKRKVSVIFNLADEATELHKARERLLAERAAMDNEKRKLKDKFGLLYTHIFQSLRDERGEPYDPNFYSLQQSSDGNVFLVPKSLPVNSKNSSTSSSSSSSKNPVIPKKRKSFDD